MPLFTVVAGRYYCGGKRYEVGAEVESTIDLVEKFPNKFKRVKTVPAIVEDEEVDASLPVEEVEATVAQTVEEQLAKVAETAKDEAEDEPPAPPAEPETPAYIIHHRGKGRYDVVNTTTNERLNAKALTKRQAEELLRDMQDDEE